ncbi:MAG TPA: sigma 54-interacting transcriptional regulator [Bacillota bacterium]|nr:sigma 54-interacting transcriptional regulator [Bacillota bacterium]
MMQVLIVGAGTGGTALFKILHEVERMRIVAMVDINKDAKGLKLAKQHNILTSHHWQNVLSENIDIVIEATGDHQVLEELLDTTKGMPTIVVPGAVAYIISELFEEKESLLEHIKHQMNYQQLILDNMHNGMIVIDQAEHVQFLNERAERIIGIRKEIAVGNHIYEIIKNSRLPHVMQSRRKELNQKVSLENDRQVISTRIPIINAHDEIMGAFAVFKDITEVVNLAEENTDLKDIKKMLEAIIQSSDEAISVVDENGLGLMINPAYTRLTGLTENDVIGQPATVDIYEGESMHLKVLKTRKPVRGVPMKVGEHKKDVLVNVAPVIVDGMVKGSVGVIHDVSEIYALTKELNKAKQKIRTLEAKYTFDDIIGPSSEMQLALEQAKVGAKTPATVLLRGESGTGKELFAHAIHNESDRKHEKFIRVNCAAIAESLLESELFGYEEGAFSGARRGGKKGFFEEAHNGSIFLDEIGELSLSTQAKLLRVLQENEIVRVGGTKPIPVDVRVITATNVNLEKAIMEHTFRADLYYRLNRLPIFIPSLRERISDLPHLVNHLINHLNEMYGRNVVKINESALEQLKNYHWPGNVRELENTIGRAMIYMQRHEKIIQTKHLLPLTIHGTNETIDQSATHISATSLTQAVDQFEKQFIQRAYEANDYNKTKTAKALDISVRTLYYKFDKYNLE